PFCQWKKLSCANRDLAYRSTASSVLPCGVAASISTRIASSDCRAGLLKSDNIHQPQQPKGKSGIINNSQRFLMSKQPRLIVTSIQGDQAFLASLAKRAKRSWPAYPEKATLST